MRVADTVNHRRGGKVCRRQRRQVALHIDDDVGMALRVSRLERLENAIRARGMIGARHHRAAARGLDAGCNLLRIGGDHHRPLGVGQLGLDVP